MASACMIISRGISTTCACHGKRNFRKFLLYNKRGSRQFKEARALKEEPDMPIDKRGVRDTGIKMDGCYYEVPEMIPELIVPSLEGFTLKPYVSYRAEEFVNQPEFTPKNLFDAVYARKIIKDFDENQLTPEGEPLNPSENEKLTPEEARIRAEKTGCDLFTMDSHPSPSSS